MGFSRTNQTDPTGSRWRLANRALLGKCGVPDAIADSDRQWAHVLLHGDDHLGTGWDVSWITQEQAAELLAALVHELPLEAGYDLMRLLRQQACCGSSRVDLRTWRRCHTFIRATSKIVVTRSAG